MANPPPSARPSLTRRASLAAVAALLAAPAAAAEPGRSGWVTDEARALDDARRAALDRELGDFERATGFEVAAVTVLSLEGKSVEDYSFALAKRWRLGKAGDDNGVLLLLAPRERKMRIETGKGVGHLLTDLQCRQILDGTMRPRLQAGDAAGALVEGARAILKALGGASQGAPGAQPRGAGAAPSPGPRVGYWIGGGVGAMVGLRLLLEAGSRASEAFRARTLREEAQAAFLENGASALRDASALEGELSRLGAGLPEPLVKRRQRAQKMASELRSTLDRLRGLSAHSSEALSLREKGDPVLRDLLQEIRPVPSMLERHKALSSPQARATIAELEGLLVDLDERFEQGALSGENRLDLRQDIDSIRKRFDDATNLHDLDQGNIDDCAKNIRGRARAVVDAIDASNARLEAQPAQVAGVRRRLDALLPSAKEAQRECGAFLDRYPAEPPARVPPIARLLSSARAALGRAEQLATRRDCPSVDGFGKALSGASDAVDKLSAAIDRCSSLEAQRSASIFSARASLERAAGLIERGRGASLSSHKQALFSEGKTLVSKAQGHLERGDSHSAEDAASRAEDALSSALLPEPPPGQPAASTSPGYSSSPSHDSGSSGGSSSYSSGSSSSSHDSSSSSSSYDSGSSSSSYDSGGSSGGYDGGGSSGGYDGGSSSGGGGDFGGGGSSSDW